MCFYWTYNKTDETCKYSSILKAGNSAVNFDVVTGDRICAGKCKHDPEQTVFSLNLVHNHSFQYFIHIAWKSMSTMLEHL